MAALERFEELEAWQLGRELTRRVYAATEEGGIVRDYHLRNELRRAAVSIPAHIAEGFESNEVTEFAQQLHTAKGTLGELRSYLYSAFDQGYMESKELNELQALATKVGQALSGLLQYLKEMPSGRPRHSVHEPPPARFSS